MALQFCSFSSGSSGNCYLVRENNHALLIDAGISGKKIFNSLEATGTALEDVEALLITHEHIDHVKSIPIVTKKLPNIFAYANDSTWKNIERPVASELKRTFTTGYDFNISNFIIRPFSIPHDASEPVGFSIYHEDRQISMLTDVGHITEDIMDEISDADLLVLEANHDKEILLMNSYPYNVKQRILGDNGHLSNSCAGECIKEITLRNPKKRQILLGHLSNENNTPSIASLTIKNTLEEKNIFLDESLSLDVLLRDTCSCIYTV